jgi:hypothetical protein
MQQRNDFDPRRPRQQQEQQQQQQQQHSTYAPSQHSAYSQPPQHYAPETLSYSQNNMSYSGDTSFNPSQQSLQVSTVISNDFLVNLNGRLITSSRLD